MKISGYLALSLGLILGYVGLAKLGFIVASYHTSVSPVWLPAGLAMIFLLKGGLKMAPVLFIAATLDDFLLTDLSFLASAGTGIAAVAGAVVGAHYTQHLLQRGPAFLRVRGIFTFVLLVGLGSPMIAAIFGMLSLELAGRAAWTDFGRLFLTWTLGDAGGVMILVPLYLCVKRDPVGVLRRTLRWEALGLLAGLVAVSGGIFLNWFRFPAGATAIYLVVPFIIWAALRFHQTGACLAVLILAGFAVYATASGQGPFTQLDVDRGLLLCQVFLFVILTTGLLVSSLASQIAASERFHRHSHMQILESAQDAIIAVDGKGAIVSANKATAEMFGYLTLELIGKPFSVLVGETSLARFRENRGRPFESTGKRQNGTTFFGEVSLSSWKSEEGECFTAVVRDISRRKKEEERRHRSEMFLRNIYSSVTDIIATVDRNGKFLSLNPAFERVTGFASADWIGKDLADLLHVEDRPRAHQMFQELKRAVCPVNLKARVVAQSGEVRYLESSARRSAEGAFEGECVWVARDATESKLREEAENKRVLVERLNEEIEQFTYMVSHDLKEPLRMVTMYVQLLEQRLGEKLNESEREFMDYATGGALRMKSMIDDLLANSRAGKLEKNEPISLDVVVRHAQDVMQGALSEKAATIEVAESLPWVSGDGARLSVVIQNLVGNALKFARKGVAPRIKIQAHLDGPSVVCSVSDNGIGFEEAFAERIFRPFERLHTRGEYPGTGLGLATCRKIVEAHGGRLWATSKVGEGSCFSFQLPAAEQVTRLDGMTILLADDAADIQFIMADYIRKSGAMLDVAANGIEAVRLGEKKRYDLVLMDLHMPLCDGFKATQELRRGGFKNPIVAYSSDKQLSTRKDCIDKGFDDYLPKEYDPDSVVRFLAKYRLVA